MASGVWLKPPLGGRLSQGRKPLALSQLLEASPPSAESQGRTFGRGQALPLPDPVPWKLPDLAMGASPAPFLPRPTSQSVSPFLGKETRWASSSAVNSCKQLHRSPSGTPHLAERGAQAQISSRQRPSCRRCGRRTVSICKPPGKAASRGPSQSQDEQEPREAAPWLHRAKGFPGGRKAMCMTVEDTPARNIWA